MWFLRKLKRLFEWVWKHDSLKAALFYACSLAIIYAPVVFSGHTLYSTNYISYGVTDQGAVYGYDGREPINTYNIDLGTAAYFEGSLNPTIGNMYRHGDLPLWNPYQAAGTPLAAQFSSRAFFPYQILEDISPSWTWDFFILGRLWFAGLFTFLFLRGLKVRMTGSLLGGLFYMLSGAFVWFINLEQMANTAMVLPLFMWAIEKTVSFQRPIHFLSTTVCTAFILLSGQPETALYAILLGGTYAIYRIVSKYGFSWGSARRFGLLAIAFCLGLGLSTPLVLPFQEMVNYSIHTHVSGSGVGTADPTTLSWSLGLICPTFFETPSPIRILPINGVWDFLGGYVGVLTLLLIFMSVFRRSQYRGLLIFFLILGGIILLKNFGIPPFYWLGKLPLFEQVWSNRWAGPIWTFSLSIAGAIGFEILEGNSENKPKLWSWNKNWRIILVGILVAGLVIWLSFKDQIWNLYVGMIPARHYMMIPHHRDYMEAAIQGGVIVTIVVIITGILLWQVVSTKARRYAFIALALIALWYYIPRGYDYNFVYLKLIPVTLGIAGVWLLALTRWRLAVSLIVVTVFVATGIDAISPYGFPERNDPFQTAPYVEYLKEQNDFSRVMAIGGILMPNSASVIGLYDVRYINSITISEYDSYMHYLRGLSPDSKNLPPPDASNLWFTGLPPFSFVPGVNFPLQPAIEQQLPYYSFLGVKYIITPSTVVLNGLPCVYEKEVNIFENTDALPRAFVVNRLEYAYSPEVAQFRIGQPGFDLRGTAVIEEYPTTKFQNSSGTPSPATIVNYQPNQVDIKVSLEEPGMLVLTDTYYPGWEARVDGKTTTIFRVNGVARGVFLDSGEHQIEFSYFANSFRQGIGIAVISLLLGGMVFWLMLRREKQPSESLFSLKDWQWWK